MTILFAIISLIAELPVGQFIPESAVGIIDTGVRRAFKSAAAFGGNYGRRQQAGFQKLKEFNLKDPLHTPGVANWAPLLFAVSPACLWECRCTPQPPFLRD